MVSGKRVGFVEIRIGQVLHVMAGVGLWLSCMEGLWSEEPVEVLVERQNM
jgi:hypothetical protein